MWFSIDSTRSGLKGFFPGMRSRPVVDLLNTCSDKELGIPRSSVDRTGSGGYFARTARGSAPVAPIPKERT